MLHTAHVLFEKWIHKWINENECGTFFQKLFKLGIAANSIQFLVQFTFIREFKLNIWKNLKEKSRLHSHKFK